MLLFDKPTYFTEKEIVVMLPATSNPQDNTSAAQPNSGSCPREE